MKVKQGKTYYVDAASGDNRHDGLDHGGFVEKKGIIVRNIHALRTIQKAIDKISKSSGISHAVLK